MEIFMAVHDALLDFLMRGWLDASWWQIVIYTLVMTHITIASVTIFLHRAQAHLALELHPIVSHFFRFWLWLTTGMVTKEWVAVHRKHHAKCETKDDPHSPQTRGIKTVLLEGGELYRAEAQNAETLEKYGHNTPDDRLEHKLYSRHVYGGIGLMLFVDVFFFGAVGVTVWAVQMAWIPVTAAGIINGLGHWWGYRNFEPKDASTNISPWGIVIGGEELHNNHHAYPSSAKLSARWYEFDIGWLYIRLLEILRLAKVKTTLPQLRVDQQAEPYTFEALQSLQRARFHVLARFDRLTQKLRVQKEEVQLLRTSLEELWKSHKTKDELLVMFRNWCREVEKIRIPKLSQFAWQLARFRNKKN